MRCVTCPAGCTPGRGGHPVVPVGDIMVLLREAKSHTYDLHGAGATEMAQGLNPDVLAEFGQNLCDADDIGKILWDMA